METEKWGPGNATEEKAFDTVKVGEETVDLIFGQFPHSRQTNTQYARTKKGEIIGFCGHRLPFKFEIEEYNYIKRSSLSGNEVRKGCSSKIFLAGTQIFSGGGRNYENAFRRANQFIIDMEENWDWFPKKVSEKVGKIVGYREQLFKIQKVVIDQAALILVTIDGVPRKKFLWESCDYGDDELTDSFQVSITSELLTWYPEM